jgi:hypothetical protein
MYQFFYVDAVFLSFTPYTFLCLQCAALGSFSVPRFFFFLQPWAQEKHRKRIVETAMPCKLARILHVCTLQAWSGMVLLQQFLR